jgi:integrase
MDLRCEEVLPEVIRGYRDDRLKLVTPGSVKRELGLISGVFGHAIKEGWITLQTNPVSLVKRPSDNKPRTQRVTDAELLAIVGDWRDAPSPETGRQWLPFLAWFAVETAMRLGEMCALRWSDFAGSHVVVQDSKSGDGRTVPLSPVAKQILDRLPRSSDYIFDLSEAIAGVRWREATVAADLGHIHLHDLRREATSRLAQKLDVMDLCRMTGHRDPRVTLAVYYQPRPEDLAAKLG